MELSHRRSVLEIRRKSPLTYVLDIISEVSGIDVRWWD